jgi:UDP:flavonoid glycosyltransferase YjiC (YdhE family)
MRAVLTTIGSLGDLHPYIAVGMALRRKGHEVVLATSGHYRRKATDAGLGFHAVGPDIEAVQADKELMRRAMDKKLGSEVVIKELVVPSLRATYEDLAAACRGADALVGHTLTYAARLVSEKTGIPWASSVLQPIGLFSALDPPVFPPFPGLIRLKFLGPWFHRGVFRVGRRMVRPWMEPWHALRADLGLPKTAENPVFEGQHSKELVLAMFSRSLAAPQPDWPAATVQTGFPFFDRDGSGGLPPALEAFLDAGPPPIVFTLGSSAVSDPRDFYHAGAEAAGLLGRRAVLLIGRDASPPASLLPGVAAFDYARFSELFPRAAAIVHQGGVGTTGQAMRSGRPMIVMPYAHDQPDNAARVARLGISRTIPRERFTAERAARELERVLGDPGYAERARAVGAAVASEDGAEKAAAAIVRWVETRR